MAETRTINNAGVHIAGFGQIGRANKITLPEIVSKTIETKSLGNIGTTEVFGGLETMEATIEWNSLYPEIISLVGNITTSTTLMIRANQQVHDSSGLTAEVPVVCYLTVIPKSLNLSEIMPHEGTTHESKFSVNAVRLEIDGVNKVNVDLFANTLELDGVDLLAKYKSNIGA